MHVLCIDVTDNKVFNLDQTHKLPTKK